MAATLITATLIAAAGLATAAPLAIAADDVATPAVADNNNAQAEVAESRERRKSWMKFSQGMQWANEAWEFKRDDLRSADVVSIDLFDSDADTVNSHQKKGRGVICYTSVGTLEWWRPDTDDVPSGVLGLNYHGKGSEKWFDVSKWQKLKGFMEKRLDRAAGMGCDAVEFDNIDCYANTCVKGKGKWDLKDDQVDYLVWLANAAHDRGMAAGFKNAVDLISTLVGHYDFAINESCTRFNECRFYEEFKDANKAVFGVEYKDTGDACWQAAKYGIAMKLNKGSSWKNC